MKAVILARVSTKEQEDGHSLDAQISNLRQYADRNNFQIIKQFTAIESSTKGERPEFMRMIDFIKAQKEKIALVVDTVDRLQRSFKETPVLNELFEKDILELHFVKESNVLNKDSNSMQKLMWNMGVVMAQSYTDSLSDNVKRSLKQKLSQGECTGSAPLGYLNAPDPERRKNTVIIDPERAFLVRNLFQEYSKGIYSIAELVRKANDWGLRTLKGKKVYTQTIHRLLQNPFYYGMMKVKGQLYPHAYDPLISKDLFDACQAVREGRGRNQAVVETKYPYIFRGLIKCAVSGRLVSCDLKKGRHIYLINRDPANPDKKLYTKENIVLDQLRGIFASIQIPEELLTEILESLKKTHRNEQDYYQASITALNKEHGILTRRLDVLLDEYLDKSITKDMYDRKHGQLIQHRQEVQEQLERHNSGDEEFRMAVSTLVSIASKALNIFDRSTTDEKRQLIGYVFSNLELKGAKLCYTLKTPFDLLVNLTSYQKWQGRQDSNLRHPVLETGALPTELHPYIVRY